MKSKGGDAVNFEPHEYQKYCIDRILDTQNLGLFLDMGLG